MIRKKWFSLLLIALLVISSFPFANFGTDSVDASSTIKKRVLEIVDNGGSQLTGELPQALYEIDTVRMKRFVALREELDGKYDFIYIGSGVYSPSPVGSYTDRSAAHNTLNKQNDITNLKANEIITDFINKNQLVVLHKDILKNSSSKLTVNFGKYLNSEPRSNVKFISSVSEVENIVNNFYKSNQTRPRIELVQKPETNSSSKVYQANEKITFNFNVTKQSTNAITAKLYIDANFNHRFEANELVQSVNVVGSTGTLDYTLPKGYSGLRYWKLEVVDQNSGLKDAVTGVFKFKGEKVNIKVLQVTSGENDGSRLTLSNNMNQSFLSTDDYHIHIDTVSMKNFTDSVHQLSHTKLNGKFDMLIFGFNDSYNGNAVLTENAAKSVQAFISTGQSVLFTHDTIFNQNNIWVNNFMNATGQINPWTNLGFGAPQQSENTKKVNEGLLTQFPFSLGNNIKIKNTHNQYYTLDLEDPNVIPWYNIIGGHRDNDDSWNHYYTYSKGNITYSGTGHTNNSFPVEEQKLFVNTMFRAFLGANTAPVINVFSPTDGRNHLKNQDLELVFEAYDLDLTDRHLKTRAYINNSTNPVYTSDVSNGAVVRATLAKEHLLVGENTVRIELQDASGAISFKEIKVNVQEAQFNINKTVSKSKTIVDEPVSVKYTISVNSPGMIDNTPATSGKVFPYAIERSAVSNTKIRIADGNSQGNYGWIESNDGSGASRLRAMILADEKLDVVVNQTITTEPGNMEIVSTVKQWLNGKTKEVNIPIVDTFPNGRKDIPVKAIGIYHIFEENGNVYLRYIREATESDNIILTGIKIEDFLPTGVQLLEEQIPNMTRQTSSAGTNVQITIDNLTLRQLYENPIVIEYTIKSSNPGVYVMDRSTFKYKLGNNVETNLPFNTITLEVVQPVTGVELRTTSSDLIVGENPRRLFFDIVPENATNKNGAINSARWSSSDPTVVSIDQDGYITAHKKGSATITVSIDDVDDINDRIPFTDSIEFNSILPLDKIIIEGSSDLFIDEVETYTIATDPTGVEIGNGVWSIKQGNEFIELNNGTVKAKAPGTAVIKVDILYKGETYTAEHLITVKEFRIDPNEIDVNIGSMVTLVPKVFRSQTASDNVTNVTWQSSSPSVATVHGNGIVTGISSGVVVITAKVTLGNIERVAKATITVKEVPLTGITAGDKIFVQKGQSKNIELIFTPTNATNKEVSFTSSNPSYVEVNSIGKVKGKEVRYGLVEGEMKILPAAIITITSSKNPQISTTVEIVVVEEGSEENENGTVPGNGGSGPNLGGNRW